MNDIVVRGVVLHDPGIPLHVHDANGATCVDHHVPHGRVSQSRDIVDHVGSGFQCGFCNRCVPGVNGDET